MYSAYLYRLKECCFLSSCTTISYHYPPLKKMPPSVTSWPILLSPSSESGKALSPSASPSSSPSLSPCTLVSCASFALVVLISCPSFALVVLVLLCPLFFFTRYPPLLRFSFNGSPLTFTPDAEAPKQVNRWVSSWCMETYPFGSPLRQRHGDGFVGNSP